MTAIIDGTNGVTTPNVLTSSSGVSLTLQSGGTTAITVDTSQNVGIGTTSPSTYGSLLALSKTAGSVYQLTIDTPSGYADGNYSGIRFSQNNTGTPVTTAFMQQLQFSSGSTNIAFGTCTNGAAATEKMRIVSDGTARFSMGNFANGPSSTNAGFSIENNGNSPFINHAQGGTGLTTYYAFINANGAVGTIKTTGSSTQFNTSSDVRLKKNIVDAPSAIASIQQIGIKSFDWKADDLHQEYGVIAQELDAVAPEAVSHGATKDEMWGVDYSKLVPRMIKAIQELKALVDAQATEIAELKAKVG